MAVAYDNDSNSSSSESEVEYEPIVIEDADGKKMVMKEESNPLAPVIIVNTKQPTSSSDKSGKPKKIKVFASKDTMLNLIESVNSIQDGKIQAKLDRDASYLQRLSNIEKATQERKSMKNERLDKIKDNLRKGGVRVKGENKRTVRKIHEKETIEREGKKTGNSRNGRSSKPKSSKTSKPASKPSKPRASKPASKSSNGKPQRKVKFSV